MRFKFSLRTLFICITLFCLLLAVSRVEYYIIDDTAPVANIVIVRCFNKRAIELSWFNSMALNKKHGVSIQFFNWYGVIWKESGIWFYDGCYVLTNRGWMSRIP